MKTCVVIGSGIGGIAAALRLRAKGYDVTVLEAAEKPGGKLSEIKLGAFRFDAGPSLFTMPQYVDELFGLFDENPREYFNYTRLDENCRYHYEDGSSLTVPSDPAKAADVIHQTFKESRNKVLNRFRRSAWLYRITAPVFLEKSLHRAATYFSRDGLRGIANLWRIGIFRTMHKENEKQFGDPRTAQLFDRYATYNGSDPYRTPSTMNVIPHLEFGFGTFFPKGGMIQIADSLYKLALRKGVRFEFGCKADRILHQNGKANGVITGSKTFPADVVICNSDIRNVYGKMLPEFKLPGKIAKAEPSSSALIFYWGIRESFHDLGLHNIFFSADYRQEFRDIFEKGIISDDPTVYIHISCKSEPEDAPAGCENWFVMVNAPPDMGQNWDQMKEQVRKNILKKLSRMTGRNVEPLICAESLLDPALIASRTSSYRGSLYGSGSNTMMSAFFRQANFHSELSNLFFCGGSVHPGGGIPLCLLSAKIVGGLTDDGHSQDKAWE